VKKKDPNHDLLVTGARDFLKACAAISKFGDEIYDAGVRVLKRRAAEMTAALRIPVNAAKVQVSQAGGYIANGEDGTETAIGPYVTLPNSTYFKLHVWWRTAESAKGRELCSAVASFECNTIPAAEALYQALRQRSKGALKTHEQYEALRGPFFWASSLSRLRRMDPTVWR
jgi:hypothetical protein